MLNRRDILKSAAALALWPLQPGEEVVDFADLAGFRTEIRAASPRIKVFDLRRLTTSNTPDAEFYTFHQTSTVTKIPSDWKLRVAGLVERAAEFSLDALKQRPDRRDLAVTLECSGNSAGPGANGQVSSGVWTGCGLASVLKECGVKPEAREIAFLGMDSTAERTSTPSPHGRSVYVQDALAPDAMLAYALNGKPLSAERGFPLRLILPGWYGMTNVKWLQRIEVLDRRFEGAHMSRNYHSVRSLESPEGASQSLIETSISRTRLKSVVARVSRRREGGGFRYRISGAAWGGPHPLKAVEVRIDDRAWLPATLVRHSAGDYAWTLWSLDWPDPVPGPHLLVSRAIDSAGGIQPSLDEFREQIKTMRENNSQWPRRIVI